MSSLKGKKPHSLTHQLLNQDLGNKRFFCLFCWTNCPVNLMEIEFGIGQPSPLLLVGEVEIFLLNVSTVSCCVGLFWALSSCGGKSPDKWVLPLWGSKPFLFICSFCCSSLHFHTCPVPRFHRGQAGWAGSWFGELASGWKAEVFLEWGRWHCSWGLAVRPWLLSPLHAWSKSPSSLWLASRAHSCSVCFLLFWLNLSLLSLFTGQAGCWNMFCLLITHLGCPFACTWPVWTL